MINLKKTLQNIGIITKSNILLRTDFLKEVVRLLKKHKKTIYLDENSAPALHLKNGSTLDEIFKKCDVIFVMGGDGTLLKTAGYIYEKKPPIFGVNLGNLGFLTETSPATFAEDLKKLFDGDYILDHRMLLDVCLYRSTKKIHRFLALNDAVINQGSFARLVTMKVDIGQEKMLTFKADGLIISSPTGSTGHSLSAGGPLVHPALSAFVLTPICPATLALRPIVVPNDREITIHLTTQRPGSKDVGLTIDGQNSFQLCCGDVVKIRKSSRPLSLIRLKGNKDYFEILRSKLHWGGHHDVTS